MSTNGDIGGSGWGSNIVHFWHKGTTFQADASQANASIDVPKFHMASQSKMCERKKLVNCKVGIFEATFCIMRTRQCEEVLLRMSNQPNGVIGRALHRKKHQIRANSLPRIQGAKGNVVGLMIHDPITKFGKAKSS